MKASFKSCRFGDNIYVDYITYDSISKIDFALCKQPKETMGSFYNRMTPDITINGGLFNMQTGVNVMSFTDEGVEQNYRNGFVGVGTTKADPLHLVYGVDKQGDWKDFITAHPVLVKDGIATTVDSWGNAKSLNYYTTRQSIGYDDNGVYIVTVDKSKGAAFSTSGDSFGDNVAESIRSVYETIKTKNGILFNQLAEIYVALGAKYAFALDGGGSVRTMHGSTVVNTPTENRPIDNVFCIYLKDVKIPFTPGYFSVTASSGLNIRDIPSSIGSKIVGGLNMNDIILIEEADYDAEWGKVGDLGWVSLAHVIRLSDYEPNPLNDISDAGLISDWAKDSVTRIITYGIMRGDEAGNFNPGNALTREEFAVAIDRTIEYIKSELSK